MGSKEFLLIISTIVLLSIELVFPPVLADPVGDKRALLDFLLGTRHSRPLNWKEDAPVCENWTGVTCSQDRSRVVSLRLPGKGFLGPIPPNTLSRLSGLQVLSLRFNSFSGPLPPYFSSLESLTVLDLSNNRFTGSIPGSLSRMTRITTINLANNSLSGEIPDLGLPSLKWMNLANNKLIGTVPKSLERFPSWAFLGNNLSSETPNPDRSRTGKLREPVLLGIVLLVSTLAFAVVSIYMIACCSSNEVDNDMAPDSNSEKKPIPERSNREDRIVSFDGFGYSFRVSNLLKFPAEVLGKGTYGNTYKVALKDGKEVAIKWVAELSVGRSEFEQLMESVGKLCHENVAPLRAYYCSSDEKLLIYDFYSEGSVSSVLHGKAADWDGPLCWDGRLKIAVGAARGLAYIHRQTGKRLVHGNLKASNIFSNSQGLGCVSDIGLTTLMNPTPPASTRAVGYRAPEIVDARYASQESDVYSFGVLLLELLTGKSPIHAPQIHLVKWVHSVVREDWSSEVFDTDLLRCPNIEDGLIEMLRIGMACVAGMPDERPNMTEVVEMVEAVYRARTKTQPSCNQESPLQIRQA